MTVTLKFLVVDIKTGREPQDAAPETSFVTAPIVIAVGSNHHEDLVRHPVICPTWQSSHRSR